ncbi:MAG: T9SS type A sorting domain-containing protein [Bacteroidia bacterium]|nr:T9SS type A sorting domain-containing protein [Bacteroidia bacterium]MCF8426395.1 T9SS type A sorting domain-containing protein [Bacteroidia bacterium]
MKKQLLTLIAALAMCGSSFAQGYYSFTKTGTTAPYSSLTTGTVVVSQGSDNVLSSAQTIPFTWNFYGKSVTSYKVSDNGYITFDQTSSTSEPNNVSLPSASAPLNSIFAFWDEIELKAIPNSSVKTEARTFTYGSSPNRVHVIQWFTASKKGTAAGSSNYLYFAIRLYEGGNFDIIYNDASPNVTGLTGTIGCQNEDGTVGTNLAGPNVDFPNKLGAQGNPTDLVYQFIYGVQPANDAEATSLTLPKFAQKNSDVFIKGKVTNYGSQSLSSFRVNYTVGADAPKSMLISGLNIAPSGGSYDFQHNIPYNTSTPGDYAVKVWISLPNNSMDEDSSNNNASGNLTIVNSTVPRKVLLEGFTSSTCGPCTPGNAKVKGILDQRVGKWNVVKYQVNFPGTGDPYYTSEVGTRFSYYGATFAPWLTVDGSNNWGATSANSNSYTTEFFDAMAAVPSLVDISANLVRNGNSVTVSGNVTPVQSFTNSNLKLRIAVVETRTVKNVKSNGETEFFNVMKKMLPTAAGSAMSLTSGSAMPYTQSFTFPGSYRLPFDGQAANIINLSTENSVEEFGNLFAIVFLQDDNDKTVWQSASTAPDGALAVTEVSELGLNIYPNPASSSFNVTFSGRSSNGSVRILDINGKEVMSQNINSMNGAINCDNLINGLYFVELTVDGKTAIKKLNIIR